MSIEAPCMWRLGEDPARVFVAGASWRAFEIPSGVGRPGLASTLEEHLTDPAPPLFCFSSLQWRKLRNKAGQGNPPRGVFLTHVSGRNLILPRAE